MFKHPTRKLAYAMLLVLLAGPVNKAFASDTGSTPNSSSTSTQAPPPTTPAITGSDPEPIEPDLVGLILTLLGLS
jgi:hypothetical protein